MKRTKMALLLILVSISIWAQEMMGPPPGECNFNGDNGMTIIPFEMVNNHVIITAMINMTTIPLLLDIIMVKTILLIVPVHTGYMI